jgi:hypothetical protein
VGGEGYVPVTLPEEGDPVPGTAEWAPLPIWVGAEKRDLTGIRSSDRPARTDSQYRLSYYSPRVTKHDAACDHRRGGNAKSDALLTVKINRLTWENPGVRLFDSFRKVRL